MPIGWNWPTCSSTAGPIAIARLCSRTLLRCARRRLAWPRRDERLKGRLRIDYVLPDALADRPKPCMEGWGRRYLTVNPQGDVLPCPTASCIESLAIRQRARAIAALDLGGVGGLQSLPRHRVDARALPQLRMAAPGFRRLPLPGRAC